MLIGLPDMQIIIHDQNTAHGGLPPARPCATVTPALIALRFSDANQSLNLIPAANATACLPPNVYTMSDTPHRSGQLHRAPSLLNFRQPFAS
jgi:hypothetical protein